MDFSASLCRLWKKPAGVAFPSAPNNCFPCGFRCRQEGLQELRLYSAQEVVFFSPVLLPVGCFLNTVTCHAAHITRKYPCRKWKSTYQAKSNTCFCISVCGRKGQTVSATQIAAWQEAKEKKLRNKHEENLLSPQMKRNRTWFIPVAVPGNNPGFIRECYNSFLFLFFLLPLHSSFSICQRPCGNRKVVWLAQWQRGADFLDCFSCILLHRDFVRCLAATWVFCFSFKRGLHGLFQKGCLLLAASLILPSTSSTCRELFCQAHCSGTAVWYERLRKFVTLLWKYPSDAWKKHLQRRQWDTCFLKAMAAFIFLSGSPDLKQMKVMNCRKGFLEHGVWHKFGKRAVDKSYNRSRTSCCSPNSPGPQMRRSVWWSYDVFNLCCLTPAWILPALLEVCASN